MRISDWSTDVCASDLLLAHPTGESSLVAVNVLLQRTSAREDDRAQARGPDLHERARTTSGHHRIGASHPLEHLVVRAEVDPLRALRRLRAPVLHPDGGLRVARRPLIYPAAQAL